MVKPSPYTLIAHRGYSGHFPENTLLAYQAAFAMGARWMECDIQLTQDKIPLVHHDDTLLRMSNENINVLETKLDDILQYSAHYPEKFSAQYYGNPFTTLEEMADWVELHTDIHLFVEIKQESIEHFGIQTCAEAILNAAKKIHTQCTYISFDHHIIQHLKETAKNTTQQGISLGWVIPKWNKKNESIAKSLHVDYLFINKKRLPPSIKDWWAVNSHWAIYNVDEFDDIPQWVNKGIQYIETNYIGQLLNPDQK